MGKKLAASVLITNAADDLLLVQRGHEPQKGRWSLPGGTAEEGESARQTAVREAKEETNLDVKLGELAVKASMQGHGDTVYDIRCYFATIVGGELTAGDDAAQVRWVPRTELEGYPLTTGLSDSLRRAGYLPPTSA